jgi:hypothetical protein
MSNRRIQTLTALLACAAAVPALAAETFTCGGQIIQPGMSQSDVLAQCGEPTSKTVTEEPVRSGNMVTGTTTTSRWTYASYSSTRVLVFDADKLVDIQDPNDPDDSGDGN